jgi:hypothetical protein
MGARIVAIADAYDAMVNDRPYKRAISHTDAIEELRRHAGTQFDPELVTVFCDLFAAVAPEPDQTVLAINASHTHRRAPAALAVANGMTPAGSGPRTTRQDRAAASGGKHGRGHAGGPAEHGTPGGRPSASIDATTTAAADAQVRMALTDAVASQQQDGPDLPDGDTTPNRPRGITTG